MIFNLSDFRDLGKCSMGTLLDTFDTELNHIYLLGSDNKYVEVSVTCVSDLFPFLWCLPGVSASDNSGHSWYFSSKLPWWHFKYDSSIEAATDTVSKLMERLHKNPDSKKFSECLKFENEYLSGLINMVARLDAEMCEQEEVLIKLNQ